MKLITALADQLCSHQPKLLRPFTDADWNAYAGCETKAPEIAETDEGTFVLDGETINVDLYTEDEKGEPHVTTFTGVFVDQAQARSVIEFLIKNPKLVFRFLGEPVGFL